MEDLTRQIGGAAGSRAAIPRDAVVVEPPPSQRPRSLASVLLGYMVIITIAITMAPFRPYVPDHVALSGYVGLGDLLANVALFAPLGFLFELRLGRPKAWIPIGALVGLALSLFVETSQIFLRGRQPSALDLATNAAGALVGALVAKRVDEVLRARLAGRLALEIPLMSLFYLLVPMLWTSGLAAAADPSRLRMAPLLGLFGGTLLTSIWWHRLKPAGVLSPLHLSLVAGGWFALGAIPGFLVNPVAMAATMVGVVVAVRWMASSPRLFQVSDRRFEVPTLARTWPLFAGYLVALALLPGGDEAMASGSIGRLRVLEWVAAFSLVGFMLAEVRGRLEEVARKWVPRIALQAAAVAAALELSHGMIFGETRAARPLLAIFAAVGGGFIYRSQVAAVRAALGRTSTAQPEPTRNARNDQRPPHLGATSHAQTGAT